MIGLCTPFWYCYDLHGSVGDRYDVSGMDVRVPSSLGFRSLGTEPISHIIALDF